MTRQRSIFVASRVLALVVGATSTPVQKRYDPGVTDTEIKIGNIMPYGGPLSAYALNGRPRSCLFQEAER